MPAVLKFYIKLKPAGCLRGAFLKRDYKYKFCNRMQIFHLISAAQLPAQKRIQIWLALECTWEDCRMEPGNAIWSDSLRATVGLGIF